MSSPIPAGGVSAALAKDRLGVPAVVFFILSAVAPLTVAAGVVTSLFKFTGLVSIGAAFLLVAVVLAIFSAGYVAMANRITNAGAFYAFVSRGLGRPAGVATSLVAVLAYNMIQVALYGIFGPAMAVFMLTKFNVDAPWWAWSLGAWAVVTILGMLRVDLNGIILGVLLTAEVVVLIVLSVAGISSPANGISFDSINPIALFQDAGSAVGALLVTGILGFVGFEASAVFSEESKNPKRTVPMATYISLGVIGIVYGFSSWAMVVHYGAENVQAVATEKGTDMMFGMSNSLVYDIGNILLLTSIFAAAVSFHNAVGRYMFALGREGVLPRALGRTNLRTGSPQAASLTQSFIGVATIATFALAGWSPDAQLFYWGGTTGGFGILLLVAITAVAIIAFFARNSQGENLWRRLIAPFIALCALAYMIFEGLRGYASMIGVAEGDTAAWALPASFGVVAVIGFIYALVLKATRPTVYQGIGYGATAAQNVSTMDQQPQPYSPVGANTYR
jgi:amino acid transporter